MRVVAVGGRSFVTGLSLAGITGLEVSGPDEALSIVSKLASEEGLGLIIVSDDLTKPIRDKLIQLRSTKPIPLIYELPSPGSRPEKIAYRDMLRQILGV